MGSVPDSTSRGTAAGGAAAGERDCALQPGLRLSSKDAREKGSTRSERKTAPGLKSERVLKGLLAGEQAGLRGVLGCPAPTC